MSLSRHTLRRARYVASAPYARAFPIFAFLLCEVADLWLRSQTVTPKRQKSNAASVL